MLIGPFLGCQLPASLSELRQEEEGTEAQDEGVQAQKGRGVRREACEAAGIHLESIHGRRMTTSCQTVH